LWLIIAILALFLLVLEMVIVKQIEGKNERITV